METRHTILHYFNKEIVLVFQLNWIPYTRNIHWNENVIRHLTSSEQFRVIEPHLTNEKYRKLPEGQMFGNLREFCSKTLYLGETMSRRKILPCSKICRRNWHFLHALSVLASVNFEPWMCIFKMSCWYIIIFMAAFL